MSFLLLVLVNPVDAWFCTDPMPGEEPWYCVYFDNINNAQTICNDDPIADMPPECDPNLQGCCCDDGGYIGYEAVCNNDFNDTITNPNACHTWCIEKDEPPEHPDPCVDFNPGDIRLEAIHIKGSSNVMLRWQQPCEAISITISRNGNNIASIASTLSSYTDTTSVWNEDYTYTILIEYSDNDYSDTASINPGHTVCSGITHTNVICVGSDPDGLGFENSYGICDGRNRYSPTGHCDSHLVCAIRDGVAQCVESSLCEQENRFLGFSDKESCYDAGYCYYDRTKTGIDMCFDCSPAMDCFDYKTGTACTDNQCGISGCVWHSFNEELGTGICKSDEGNYCPYAANPAGNFNTGAYTPLITPTTESTIQPFFSTGAATCSGDVACLLDASCMAYDGNPGACYANECNAGIYNEEGGCSYSTGDGLCTRHVEIGGLTLEPCRTLTGEARVSCELDYFPPVTTLAVNNVANNVRFDLSISDQVRSTGDYELIQSPYTEGYTTSLCIATSSEGGCTSPRITYDQTNPTFYIEYIMEKFSIERGRTYYLIANSTDRYMNMERDEARREFSVPEIIEPPVPPEPEAYGIHLISPSPTEYPFEAGKSFSLMVRTTRPTAECSYTIQNAAPRAMNQNTAHTFISDSITRTESTSVAISCTSNEDESATETYQLTSYPSGTTIGIEKVYFLPEMITHRTDNGWESRLIVTTNLPSRCKYSWASGTSYNSKFSYPEQEENQHLYVKEHVIPIAITDDIDSAESRTAYIQCKSAIDQSTTTDRTAILQIHPYAPGEYWINVIRPEKYDEVVNNYYAHYTVPYNITTAIPSRCTATVGEREINIGTGVLTFFSGSFNVESEGFYNMTVNCVYDLDTGDQGSGSRTVSDFKVIGEPPEPPPEPPPPPPPDPEEYIIKLELPAGHSFRENTPFTLGVSVSHPTLGCNYTMDGAQNVPLQPRTNLFMSDEITRFNSADVVISCMSNEGEDVSRTYHLKSIPETAVIEIESAYFMPDRVMQRIDNAWRSELIVNTNIPSRCRYSWSPNTPYNSKTSYPAQQNDNNFYNTSHAIPIALTSNIQSPENRTVYVQCMSPFEESSRFTDDHTSLLMIYPNAPGDFWINIIQPSNYNATPRNYHTHYTVPYEITTALPSTCTASVSGIDIDIGTGQRTSFTGTFDVGSSGLYRITVDCMYTFGAQQRQGSTQMHFYVDADKPTVSVRIGDNSSHSSTQLHTDNFSFTTSYSDSYSGINRAGFTVLRKDSSSNMVIAGTGTLPSQNVIDLIRTHQGPLRDMHAYYVNVSVLDNAGNIRSRLSNELLIDLPDLCKDGFQNNEETDVDCGGPDCPGCTAGKRCITTSDCADGLLCLEGNDGRVCAPAHCNDGIRNHGEEDVDCGPVCFRDCKENIRMLMPQFGYTHTRSFSILINTYESSTCGYRNANVPAGMVIPITEQNSRNHTIPNYQIPPGETSDIITIVCTSAQGVVRDRNFTLVLDPDAPLIDTLNAVPNPVTIRSFNSAEAKTAYWTTIGAVTDKEAHCKYSFDNRPYAQMEHVLGKGISEDRYSDYKQVNTRAVGLESQGTYNVYVACRGLNSLISSTKSISVVVNENAQIKPLIVSPPSGSTYSSRTVNVTVNPVYSATSCNARITGQEAVSQLTRQGSSFTGTITVPSDGAHTINATCTYPTAPFVTQGSVSSAFRVDTVPPNITRVIASDPLTRNTTVTVHPRGVRIDADAVDATSGITRFYYTVRVNNQDVSNGTRIIGARNDASITMYDNNLRLENNDNILVRVGARDAAGNNASIVTSNTLRYVFVEPPPTCSDGIRNGNETDVDCGGECPACGEGKSCNIDPDCEPGLECVNGKCTPKVDVCKDEHFYEEYMSDLNCGGICPGCDIGKKCNEDDDCKGGLYCNSITGTCQLDVNAVCTNKMHDTAYESDVDCGGICALELNLTCAAGKRCRQETDCDEGLACVNGICTSAKTMPDYCYDDLRNNSMNTTDGIVYCGHDCEERCDEGYGCVFDRDCKSPLRCENNVCVRSQSPETCQGSDPIHACGGDCPDKCRISQMCNIDGDCRDGLECVNGICARSTSPECSTDADCGSGEACVNGVCRKPEATGNVGQPCHSDGTCYDNLRCNSDFICEEPSGVSWVRIVLFIILLALLAAIGYYAYITYYQPPDKKPDFLKTKEELAKGKPGEKPPSSSTGPLKMEGPSHTIKPPQGSVPIKNEKVDALLDKKRKEEKKAEIAKLFGEFDKSAFDDDTPSSNNRPVDVIKKSGKAAHDDKPPVPVRVKGSENTFKDLLDVAKKEVSKEKSKGSEKTVKSAKTTGKSEGSGTKSSGAGKRGSKDEKGAVR